MHEWIQEIKNAFGRTKKLSPFKKVLLAIFFALFVIICSWILLNLELAQHSNDNIKTVDTILISLADEDYKQAYTLFSEKYKNEEDFKTFKKNILPGKATFLGYKPNSFHITRTTRFLIPLTPATLRYIGEIAYQDGESTEIIAIFIFENNKWKVYSLEVIPTNTRLQEITPENNTVIYKNAI